MREKLKAALQKVREAVELRDLVCLTGLVCIARGLAMIHEPAAWIAVGAALFWLATRRINGAA